MKLRHKMILFQMERYATDLKLSFGFCFISLYGYFQFLYLLPCITTPACKPEAVGCVTQLIRGRKSISVTQNCLYSIVVTFLIQMPKLLRVNRHFSTNNLTLCEL